MKRICPTILLLACPCFLGGIGWFFKGNSADCMSVKIRSYWCKVTLFIISLVFFTTNFWQHPLMCFPSQFDFFCLYFGVTAAGSVAEKAEVPDISCGLWKRNSIELPLVQTIKITKVWALTYGLGEILHAFSVFK